MPTRNEMTPPKNNNRPVRVVGALFVSCPTSQMGAPVSIRNMPSTTDFWGLFFPFRIFPAVSHGASFFFFLGNSDLRYLKRLGFNDGTT